MYLQQRECQLVAVSKRKIPGKKEAKTSIYLPSTFMVMWSICRSDYTYSTISSKAFTLRTTLQCRSLNFPSFVLLDHEIKATEV